VGAGTTVVQIDVEANGIGGEVACDLPVIGDAKLTVAALLQALNGPAQTGWRTPEMAQRIAAGRWRDVAFEPSARSGYVDPRTVSLEIARRLPADILVAVDSGHFLGWPAFYFDPPDARSWVFVNAFQAVGLGLGNAIGAAVAGGERLTVAALGDGGTFLALQELETAARLRLRLLVVVYDDAAYGAEVHHFRTLGEDVAFAQFPDVDLAAIAVACGARAQVVRSPGDLAVLDEWLATGAGAGPLVLDAKVDPEVVAEWLEDAFKAD
jgi:thiamine pyrophosphate-dependent acetolactate synthase large subunit-like protein